MPNAAILRQASEEEWELRNPPRDTDTARKMRGDIDTARKMRAVKEHE